MAKRILLLGSTGKMGLALHKIFSSDYSVIGKNSKDFDALDFVQVRGLIEENKPDIVINTAAFLGIDPCEKEPEKAFRLNTLYPKLLAGLSGEYSFLLIHFSTDAVFNDEKKDFYLEDDQPHPLNIYGFTKYGGDCFVQTLARRFYVFRVPLLFGETAKDTQFVEKMLLKVKKGERSLNISSDIVSSPTYSDDVAKEIKMIMEASYPFGIYHIANEGMASLYELMVEIVKNAYPEIVVKEASYKDFPFVGIKNTYTPIKSNKVASLRPWREAVKEYCNNLKADIAKGN